MEDDFFSSMSWEWNVIIPTELNSMIFQGGWLNHQADWVIMGYATNKMWSFSVLWAHGEYPQQTPTGQWWSHFFDNPQTIERPKLGWPLGRLDKFEGPLFSLTGLMVRDNYPNTARKSFQVHELWMNFIQKHGVSGIWREVPNLVLDFPSPKPSSSWNQVAWDVWNSVSHSIDCSRTWFSLSYIAFCIG